MIDTLPFSEACERNKAPILARLLHVFAKSSRVLEIGSGTGQHAVHFGTGMPWLSWICTDRTDALGSLKARLRTSTLPNLEGPLALDVTGKWPTISVDAVFSANTTHIMPWPAVRQMISGIERLLPVKGCLVIYGPFNYGGRSTSAGNAVFDRSLQARGGGEGIRDIEALISLAGEHSLYLRADCAMPANNRLLVLGKFA